MGATPFVILLPPSEGKATGGNPKKPWSFNSGVFGPAFGDFRADIADALQLAKGGDQKLLGVKGAYLTHAQACNRSVKGAPTLPAWQRYTGVVWDHLHLQSVPGSARAAYIKRIFVPSGLAGLVRADDPLPEYRLKMGARLPSVGLVSAWWRDDLTAALASSVKKTIVVDLLPQEHKSAFDWDALHVVHVDLVSKKGAVVGGHNAKAAKGLLARHLLDGGQTSLSSLITTFSHPEYRAKETS
jgi:cytoplasmic iron level regulating protein YaaA (DUF328/UPF0246 family)